MNGNTAFRRNYEPNLPGCFHVETPWLYRNPFTQDPAELGRICAGMLEREIIFQSPDTIAAFIAEPVQGAGGVIVPPENYWPLIREVCDRYGILLIADEIVTGFGRTGSMFGSRGWGVKPNLGLCQRSGRGGARARRTGAAGWHENHSVAAAGGRIGAARRAGRRIGRGLR